MSEEDGPKEVATSHYDSHFLENFISYFRTEVVDFSLYGVFERGRGYTLS
jgi:hypothetical protein